MLPGTRVRIKPEFYQLHGIEGGIVISAEEILKTRPHPAIQEYQGYRWVHRDGIDGIPGEDTPYSLIKECELEVE